MPRVAGIEMPGRVTMPAEAVASLGGSQALRDAMRKSGGDLQLRLTKDYTYQAPLPMQRRRASDLLVRAKRRRDGSRGWDCSVVGLVDVTFRTRTLPDFLCVPGAGLGHGGAVVDGSCEREFDDSYQSEDYMPPAFFTRLQTPFPYDFEENAWVTRYRVQSVSEAIGTGEEVLHRAWINMSSLRFCDPPGEVPATAPQGSREQLHDSERPFAEAVRELFEKRSVWLRGPLEAQLAARGFARQTVTLMQKAFRCVAFLFVDGPWRNAYVRLGVDPRTSPQDTKALQVIDFRDRWFRSQTRYYGSVAQSRKTAEGENATPSDSFFRVPPSSRSQLYQLVDIEDDFIQDALRSSETLEECSEQTGWLPRATIDEIRSLMQAKADVMRRRQEGLGGCHDEDAKHMERAAAAARLPKRRRQRSQSRKPQGMRTVEGDEEHQVESRGVAGENGKEDKELHGEDDLPATESLEDGGDDEDGFCGDGDDDG